MLAMIAFIATLIRSSPVGYMATATTIPTRATSLLRGDVAVRLLDVCLALANNFLLLMAFWEGVGFVRTCSWAITTEDRALGVAELDRDERRVALVEVHDAGLDPERAQRAHAADAEQHVLGQPRVRVADVELRGDPAGDAVLGRSASSRNSGTRPTSTRQIWATTCSPSIGTVTVSGAPSSPVTSAAGGGRDRSRPSTRAASPSVDALAEVALVVHQADRDERQRAVGGLLEDVAGQRAEAAASRPGSEPWTPYSAQKNATGARGRPALARPVARRSSAIARSTARSRSSSSRRRRRARARAARPPGAGAPGCCRTAASGRRDRLEQLRAARQPGPAVVVGDWASGASGSGSRDASASAARRTIVSSRRHPRDHATPALQTLR